MEESRKHEVNAGVETRITIMCLWPFCRSPCEVTPLLKVRGQYLELSFELSLRIAPRKVASEQSRHYAY